MDATKAGFTSITPAQANADDHKSKSITQGKQSAWIQGKPTGLGTDEGVVVGWLSLSGGWSLASLGPGQRHTLSLPTATTTTTQSSIHPQPPQKTDHHHHLITSAQSVSISADSETLFFFCWQKPSRSCQCSQPGLPPTTTILHSQPHLSLQTVTPSHHHHPSRSQRPSLPPPPSQPPPTTRPTTTFL